MKYLLEIDWIALNQFIKYLLVGFLNTGIGYSVIFGCMFFLQVDPVLSNFFGYFVGAVFSYNVNRRFTFKFNSVGNRTFILFIVSICFSYVFNLMALVLLIEFFYVNPFLSQIMAGAVYVVVGYLLNKFFVFK